MNSWFIRNSGKNIIFNSLKRQRMSLICSRNAAFSDLFKDKEKTAEKIYADKQERELLKKLLKKLASEEVHEKPKEKPENEKLKVSLIK
jgi:hypothetical protein